jgi:hypothetical protein
LRAPIAATVVLVSLWTVFTLGAWQLAGPIGAVADDVESRLGLDLNPGKPKKDAPKDSDSPGADGAAPPAKAGKAKKPTLHAGPAKEDD